ncbi:hypothetical protein AMTRI_Chr03g149310 [Amborella trichopoda]
MILYSKTTNHTADSPIQTSYGSVYCFFMCFFCCFTIYSHSKKAIRTNLWDARFGSLIRFLNHWVNYLFEISCYIDYSNIIVRTKGNVCLDWSFPLVHFDQIFCFFCGLNSL